MSRVYIVEHCWSVAKRIVTFVTLTRWWVRSGTLDPWDDLLLAQEESWRHASPMARQFFLPKLIFQNPKELELSCCDLWHCSALANLPSALPKKSYQFLTFELFVERAAKVIYVPVIALHLSWQKFIGHENMAFCIFTVLLGRTFQMKRHFQRPSRRSGGFGAVSLTTFASLGLICYSLYGMEFLECAYLHHGHLMQYHWTSIGPWYHVFHFFSFNFFYLLSKLGKMKIFLQLFLETPKFFLEVLKLLIWAGKRRDPQHSFSATRTQRMQNSRIFIFFHRKTSDPTWQLRFLPQLRGLFLPGGIFRGHCSLCSDPSAASAGDSKMRHVLSKKQSMN